MNCFLAVEPVFHETFTKIASLQKDIRACCRGKSGGNRLRAQLENMASDHLLAEANELQPILKSIESCRLDDQFYTLPEKEAREMIESCEQLKFRLLAAALTNDPQHLSQQINSSAKVPGITRQPSGIAHGVLNGNLIILLPELETRARGEEAIQDLMTIYDTAPARRSNWVIDFSAVSSVPSILFLGFIKALREDLARYNFSLSICWLRVDSLPGDFCGSLTEALNVRRQGQFLFSARS